MFFRKVIYIGESDGQAIYVNVEKPRDPLAAPKSKLLNTEASRGNRKQIILITSFLIAFSGVMQLFPETRLFGGVYGYGTLVYFLIVWSLEGTLLLVIVERALYKNVTLGKKIFAWIFTVFMALMGLIGPILVISILVFNMIGTPIGSEIITLSFMGILPAAAVLLLWQNNMVRWFMAVERYRKNRYNKIS